MEASNLQIYWHESQPIYSLCFQPNQEGKPRLFTAGGDNRIRAWQLNFDEVSKTKIDTIDYLSSLTQHEQAVNVVRFNHRGDTLATAGDDGQLLLWKINETKEKQFGVSDAEFEEFNETWSVWKRLRSNGSGIGAYEVYDMAWSPKDDYIVTGSMDNAIRVFHVATGECVAHMTDHNHYTQGVAWDPLDQLILSQSADRAVNVYEIIRDQDAESKLQLKLKNKIMKCELPQRHKETDQLNLSNTKLSFLFHNETLPSFFRRPAISPCGSLICIPAGILKSDTGAESNSLPELNNAVYLYTRAAIKNNFNKPIMCLSFLKKPATVISFNPNFYKLTDNTKSYLKLPYKLVFAVATSNEVLIYDTESVKPLAIIGNLHYTPLTDLAWKQDGSLLMVSSTDGFCSYISIQPSTLGEKITPQIAEPIGSSEKTDIPSTSPAKTSIINLLPVKRKNTSNSESESGKQKDKRRVQPTLINIE